MTLYTSRREAKKRFIERNTPRKIHLSLASGPDYFAHQAVITDVKANVEARAASYDDATASYEVVTYAELGLEAFAPTSANGFDIELRRDDANRAQL